MKALTSFFFRVATGYRFLIFFSLQLLFSVIILPYYQKQFDPKMTIGVPDLSFGFSAETLHSMLDQYGEDGRPAYFFVASVIDIIYPVVYAVSLCLLLTLLFKRNGWSRRKILVLLPIFVAMSDFMENLGIVMAAREFPEINESWAWFGSTAGMIKWILFGVCLAILVMSLITWLFKRISNRNVSKSA